MESASEGEMENGVIDLDADMSADEEICREHVQQDMVLLETEK